MFDPHPDAVGDLTVGQPYVLTEARDQASVDPTVERGVGDAVFVGGIAKSDELALRTSLAVHATSSVVARLVALGQGVESAIYALLLRVSTWEGFTSRPSRIALQDVGSL
jgi:hypothetical protein